MKGFCDSCQKASASVHVTELKEGRKVEKHLCDSCAETQGIPPKPTPVSMLDIFQQLVEKTGGAARSRDRACSTCGNTFSEFKAKGRFGCADDYEVFLSRVIPLLERIHGSSEHAPDTDEEQTDVSPEVTSSRAELRRLHSDLSRVIRQEEYEEAAKNRDRIQLLEEALGDRGTG